jgi:hypothetical protein
MAGDSCHFRAIIDICRGGREDLSFQIIIRI